MIYKILQPLNKYSNEFLKNLPTEEINGRILRKLVRDERRKITSCQCYHNCNCYGYFIGSIKSYYRDIKFDNTNKSFYSDCDYIPKDYNFA